MKDSASSECGNTLVEMHAECFWGSWRAALVTTATGMMLKDLGKLSEGEFMSSSPSSDNSLCMRTDEVCNGVQAEVQRLSSVNLSLEAKFKTCQDEKTEEAEVLRSMADKLERELSASTYSVSLLEMKMKEIVTDKQRIEMELEKSQTEEAAANVLANEQSQEQEKIVASLQMDRDAAVAEIERIQEESLRDQEEKRQLSSRYEKLKDKVESTEKSLQKQCADMEKIVSRNNDLETKLVDVEHFLATARGVYVTDLENDYARIKLLLAEAEADRDDLEIQLEKA